MHIRKRSSCDSGSAIGAELVGRILRGDHEERRGQGAGLALDRDLVFLHRLEQRALGLGAGAVDLVGEQHLREHRSGVEDERFLAALVDADADRSRRHQVGGELHAREAAGRARPRSHAPAWSCRPRERPRSAGARRRAGRRRSPRSGAGLPTIIVLSWSMSRSAGSARGRLIGHVIENWPQARPRAIVTNDNRLFTPIPIAATTTWAAAIPNAPSGSTRSTTTCWPPASAMRSIGARRRWSTLERPRRWPTSSRLRRRDARACWSAIAAGGRPRPDRPRHDRRAPAPGTPCCAPPAPWWPPPTR